MLCLNLYFRSIQIQSGNHVKLRQRSWEDSQRKSTHAPRLFVVYLKSAGIARDRLIEIFHGAYGRQTIFLSRLLSHMQTEKLTFSVRNSRIG